MATEIKKLSYFPLDTQFFENEKIEMLMANFGFEASGVYIKLLCKIYTNGYYMRWNETICKVFTYSLHSRFNSKKVQQIIDFLVEFNFFNKKLFLEHQILTSKGIQERFFEIISRRKNFVCENVEYLLVPIPKRFSESKNGSKMQQSSPLNDEKCNISGDSAGENVDISKQSKVKESRVKERKVYNFFNSSSNSESAKNFAENDSEVETVEAEVLTPDSEQSSSENVFQIVGNGSGEFEAKCHKWYEELRKDEEWLSSIVRSSGKGMEVLNLLKDILPLFESHIISMGESGQITTINDYKRRFINWWRCLDFKSAYEIQNRKEKNRSYNFERRQAEPLSNVDKAMECGKKAKIMAREILRKSGGLENVF